MIVTDLQYIPADETHRRTGLLGWVRLVLGGAIVIDGLAIRRTRTGNLVITWPRKSNGRPVATPANASARRRIENAIIEALGEEIDAGTTPSSTRTNSPKMSPTRAHLRTGGLVLPRYEFESHPVSGQSPTTEK